MEARSLMRPLRSPSRGRPSPPALPELEDDVLPLQTLALTQPDLSRRRGVRPDTPFGPSSQAWTHRFCTLPAWDSSYLGILLVFSAMVNGGGCAVASPRTWGPGVVFCNLQQPDSAQGPSGSLPPFLSRFWGSLVTPPQLQPQAEAGHIEALETHWVRVQTSPSLSFRPVEGGWSSLPSGVFEVK